MYLDAHTPRVSLGAGVSVAPNDGFSFFGANWRHIGGSQPEEALCLSRARGVYPLYTTSRLDSLSATTPRLCF